MAPIRGEAGLDRLPLELVLSILEELPQRTLYSLCFVSTKIRRVAEPLLYRNITIRQVSASKIFHRSATQIANRADLVRQLVYEYTSEETRYSCPDDEDILAHLSNLEKLSFISPYQTSSAWKLLLPSAIDPLSKAPILQNLTSCHLAFWDDNGENWYPDQSLCILYLPSLRRLSINNLRCSSLPSPPCRTIASLPPLGLLSFSDCDLHESGLDYFLAIRQASALSYTYLKESYPPLEENGSELSAYVPALERCATALEALRIRRYFDREIEPIPLRALTALRTLSIDPEILFGDAMGGYMQLENTLPPNLEALLLEGCWDDEIFWAQLQHMVGRILDAKQVLLPRLRRLEFIGEHGWKLDHMDVELRKKAEHRGVELVFRQGHDLIEWL